MADYEDDMVPGDNAVRNLAALAKLQVEHEESVARLGAELKAAKKVLASISQKELPEAMAATGMKEFTLDDGTKITVKAGMNVSLTGKYKLPAIDWLKAVGSDAIIESMVVIDCANVADAKTLAYELTEELGREAGVSESINTARFKAVVRERLADGENVPIEDLGVHTWAESNVKLPK